MREVIRVVILPLILMGGILGIFYLVFGRRIREREDPHGVRTHATFDGFDMDSEDSARAGQTIAGKLHGQLKKTGLDVNAVEPENYGWKLEAGAEKQGFIVRIGHLGDDAAPWLLYVDPMRATRGAVEDSPGLRRMLTECHSALGGMGAKTIAWHRREDHATGHRDRGVKRPF
ncbi:MAG: hypothetical protein JRH20_08915 [Deltaproteobacteria bacterium]|nr:hypothetical protein [Deltaproteobacteria bacterium]